MYTKPKQKHNYYCKICDKYYIDTCFMHYAIKGSGELKYD
jgi:hypothetical protein